MGNVVFFNSDKAPELFYISYKDSLKNVSETGTVDRYVQYSLGLALRSEATEPMRYPASLSSISIIFLTKNQNSGCII
jgi:hypothetical protein